MAKRYRCLAALFSIITIGCSSTASGQRSTTTTIPVVSESDIVYSSTEGVELMLDIARPATGGPFPAIMFLFGGGYTSGSRKNWSVEIKDAAQRGYVGVAVDYRLLIARENGKPKYPFPAQIYDVKCAVRWLRANAIKYAIEADRIGVIGFSAGGELSLLLALTEVSDGLEGPCAAEMPSNVQVAVNIAGSSDFIRAYEISPFNVGLLLGGSPTQFPDRYTAASARTYIGGKDAPVLSVCGSEDPRYVQLRLFDDQMKAARSDHTLIIVQGVGHNLYALVYFPQDNPVWRFFDKNLK